METEKGTMKNVSKSILEFAEKHLWQSLFFNKITAWKPTTFLEKDLGTGVFLWNLPVFLGHYIYSYDWIEITIQVTCYCQSSYESLRQQFWDHLWSLSYGSSVRVEEFELHFI